MSSKPKEKEKGEKEKEAVVEASPPSVVEKKKYAYRSPRLGDSFQAYVPTLEGDGLMVSTYQALFTQVKIMTDRRKR